MLFTTDEPTTGWDGTYNGKEMPAGIYVWKVVMKSFASDVKDAVELKESGTLMLMR